MAVDQNSKVIVENVNVPGHKVALDARKYEEMRRVMVLVLPKEEPGMTQQEIRESVVKHLDEGMFPGGSKAQWWAKMVQLDLEARGLVDREPSKPIRWHLRQQ